MRERPRSPGGCAPGQPPRNRDPGQSVLVNYLLTLAIVTLLGTGLFLATGTLVEDQQERAIRSELDVTGNHLAAEFGSADRLARSRASTTTVTVSRRVDLPEHAGGSSYAIRVGNETSTGAQPLTLTSANPEVTVTVLVETGIPIREGTVSGGPVVVEYDSGAGELVIENA